MKCPGAYDLCRESLMIPMAVARWAHLIRQADPCSQTKINEKCFFKVFKREDYHY
jgi:hypothetical protein